ncbi:COMPASS subunit protein SWD1 KNAG_0B05540 [Huiozyma naganishii CBS 8797]|uniref:Uncharacterized protein n=1 Tax=Huiozyma naganishii (strain ATCC MYA-139 / BCRC 22969 / CBS 8797 / KCTC 17520 / NBRC 10181 / NCYC 3082 / Yp74L-3) TaxID=1071383 RepID=J7RVP4_HUIN7|nr:hypothetical protein KNAG_0B05540 [Kazachstania naganishii CBS 8797]CCK68987.1 hypothetical protein KNAG_0B05540 [Kazachstania naganishii CBS 8797]
MNLLLQDPFSVLKEYPEKLTHTIQLPFKSTCLSFSRRGEYLAMGGINGMVMVYDMDTYRPIAVLGSEAGAHVRTVQCLAWHVSRGGRFLLSAGRDWTVKVWDIACPGRPHGEYKFSAPVWGGHWVESGPTKLQCVATVLEERFALFMDFTAGDHPPAVVPVMDAREGIDEGDAEGDHGYVLTSAVHPKFKDVVVTGSSKGWLKFYRILDGTPASFQLVYSERIASSNIKHVVICENGDRMAINCSDRTIRQYSLHLEAESSTTIRVEMELEHRYQDVINKLQWNCIIFSNKSGDYLVASPHGSSTHELYLWETHSGSLVRVLEGAEEELMDIDWNFYTMSIASIGFESGDIYVWSLIVPPKWSALAPDFEEVEENIEYLEKEDEFDQVDEQANTDDRLQEETDVPIDLTAGERYDVRGNDLLYRQFPFPVDYQRILMVNQNSRIH